MRRLLSVLPVILAAAPALAADDATARYEALVKSARQSDGPVDWQALRFAYAATPGFDVLGTKTSDLRKKMVEAYEAGDDAAALAEADRILDQNYADILAHVISDQAHRRQGDDARARQEHDIVVALLHSIATGDGRTPATAMTVISVGEEYDYLRTLNYQSHQQSLVSEGGHSYDRLDAERDGQSRVFYFLIDRVLAAEKALLKPKP